jgi:hypothetical protein
MKYLDRAAELLSSSPQRFIAHMQAFLTILTPGLLEEVMNEVSQSREARLMRILNKLEEEGGMVKLDSLSKEELELIHPYLGDHKNMPASLFHLNRINIELPYYQRVLHAIIAVLDSHDMLLRASEGLRGEFE